MKLTGIYAPIVTPFDAEENIHYPVLERLIDFLIENGISGLVPGGTTGEVYALSEAERLELFQFVRNCAGERTMLIAGVNAGATREVIRFAQAAERMGYQALMAAVPPYSRPTQRELLAHYRLLAQNTGLPIILYNFPWRAGTEVGYEVMDGLLDLPNIIGIKEASSEMSRVYEFRLRYGERFQMICGSDDQALDYFLWGSTAWIGGGASCAPRQHAAVLQAALRGDFQAARAAMEKLMPFLRALESGNYTQKVKRGCELLGFAVGAPRRPLLPLEESERAAFDAVFTSLMTA
ncbi:MAG: 4-hydroxy-tetrahydrodipicolinate synthase [Anaerolineales bacterium]|nr:4-hydroxy-tetrahydrodipicolinate synthase [Anaerolineales bacterium]MDW8276829.1 4-hydroxy-tetrahydrodipicolinate synthase [Anaerolineales bacterium]